MARICATFGYPRTSGGPLYSFNISRARYLGYVIHRLLFWLTHESPTDMHSSQCFRTNENIANETTPIDHCRYHL